MKILQLNIWGGKLGKQIIDLLNREDADIVCLQEVNQLEGGKNFLFEDLDGLKQKTGYAFSSFHPELGYKFMSRTAKMGLAIFSKKPFLETDEIFTRLKYTENFDLLDGDYNVRSLQRVTVDNNGSKLHVLNHHGHHVHGHKDGDEETLRQCQMIADYVSGLTEPVVLCGDFNLSSDSESLGLINKKLVNYIKDKKIISTRTHLTDKLEACDYIFTTPDIKVTTFQVLDDVVSDHKALVIEF